MKIPKIIFSVVSILILVWSCTPTTHKKVITEKKISPPPIQNNEIIHSKIADQEAIVGSQWNTFFIVPNPSHAKIISKSFSGSNTSIITHHGHGISAIRTTTRKMNGHQDTLKVKIATEIGEAHFNFHLSSKQNSKAFRYISNRKDLLQTLKDLQNKKKPTTLFLNSGNYGDVTINQTNHLTITSAIQQKPIISSIQINQSNDINIMSAQIESIQPKGKNAYYIKIDQKSTNITISNCQIQAAGQTETWQPADWKSKAANGIFSEANNSTFSNNLIKNIHHGLETKGDNCLVSNNIIIRFAGDAIRNTGNNNTFDSNYLADAVVDDYYDKDGNHDDLFQAWTFDKPISNLTIVNNIAINCTDTTIHLPSKNVQGIACFDGMEENWKIKNNLVIVDHPHGIALFGAQNCEIINNKVIPNPFHRYEFESAPWIMIHDHKDGRKSHSNQIINNLVSVLKIDDSTATIQNNTLIDSIPSKTFPNYEHWIF
ncbi:MAG TPA: hypothetical protein ENK85_11215 [Saprospiraceae bacterium]|nr:hypothetical protein [Saprospiraceae bacterium]